MVTSDLKRLIDFLALPQNYFNFTVSFIINKYIFKQNNINFETFIFENYIYLS